MSGRHARQRGVNLIELIIAIVIISIAITGVLMVFTATVGRSADPMVQQQAVAIAEGYLEEILARPLDDPDATNAGETRATFDNVGDYHGLSESPPRDQNDNVLPGLTGYTVTVAVTASAFGPAGDPVPATDAVRVDVRVTYPPAVDTTLSGYRAR